MRKFMSLLLAGAFLSASAGAQTQTPTTPQQDTDDDEVVRITSALVQTDVVVTDKNDQIISDLKLEDFELYENGKKQDLRFMEFVGVDTGRRTEGRMPAGTVAGINTDIQRDMTARDVRRVVAFVIDDLTIPFSDIITVRQVLNDFVNNEMREGDLIAIIRTVGGKGLLQQFTNDRQLLRRSIAALNVVSNPFSAFDNPNQDKQTSVPQPAGGGGDIGGFAENNISDIGGQDLGSTDNETQRLFRGLLGLSTANFVIDSLKEIPGRKSLVLFSGGIPIFETMNSGSAYSNVSYMLNRLTDNAVRAGVVINTMDPRGLKASPGVVGFGATPGRSGLSSVDPTFGRGGAQDLAVFGNPLAGGAEHLSLSTVANATGGVAVINTNNFRAGLEKVLARSRGYYLLAYTPSERFDNKFRKISVKVRREGARVHKHEGYLAREEGGANAPRTKEEAIVSAAKSPLAKRDVDVAANLILKPAADKASLDIHMLIDAKKLKFKQSAEGKYQTSLDVVGFLYDELGKLRGGFSETINTNLAPADYQRILNGGLAYSASTQLPPGYYQMRAVVREGGTGNLGTLTRYVEVPNLAAGRLAMSSLFLYAVSKQGDKTTAEPLTSLRRLSRNQDIRYAATIHNAKLEGGKPQLRSQLIISQNGKVLFQEPEQPVEATSNNAAIYKVGQLGLSKVPAGNYVLTLVVTDPLADKKRQTVSRSIDFTVTN